MAGKGKKAVMLFDQRNRWRVSSICMNRRQNYGIYIQPKLKNPDNEDIIIPVCILLIAAGFQQYRGNRFGILWIRPWIARRKPCNRTLKGHMAICPFEI
jgi:hypothetical protein